MARELQITRVRENMIGARIVAGLTQEDVADKLGITRQSLQTYEKDPERVTLGTWLKLAEIYGKEVAYFFGG